MLKYIGSLQQFLLGDIEIAILLDKKKQHIFTFTVTDNYSVY